MHRHDLTKDGFPEETCGLLMRILPAPPGNQSPAGECGGSLARVGRGDGAAGGGEGVVRATGIGVSKEGWQHWPHLCSLSWAPSLLSFLSPCFGRVSFIFVGVTEGTVVRQEQGLHLWFTTHRFLISDHNDIF